MAYEKRGYASGEQNPNAKLSVAQVRQARILHVPGSKTRGCTALARRFGVSQPAMLDALNRVTWRDV
ncbi:hypothetical protein [Paraburkholderia sp. GAS348]|uniref:hypothetical protein n=1 Tax=Paraburkholderia sp. GAS348 TaxID=3035132 RepID=UPI003D25B977